LFKQVLPQADTSKREKVKKEKGKRRKYVIADTGNVYQIF
jgi:hypothetical protein